MWWDGSRVVDIYLASGRIGVSDPAESPAWKVFGNAIADMQLLTGEVASTVQVRTKVKVWLSGELARPFMFGPVAGLQRWAEVERVLEAAAPEATGLDVPCKVWVDGDLTRRACIAVAVPAALVDALAAAKREGRLAVVSVRPWWSAALNAMLASQPGAELVMIDDRDALTVLHGSAGLYMTATTGWPHPADQLSQWLARQQVAYAADPAKAAYGVIGLPVDGPTAGLQPLDKVPFGATVEVRG